MVYQPLPLTGERTSPGIAHETYWFARHVAAYREAAARTRGLRVLDAGSGEGYGADLLGRSAASVVGVELDPAVVEHARRHYPRPSFIQADVCDLPVPTESVDAVVSLQVIEHLPDIGRYLSEVSRVLVPGGIFVCATPNRLTFTLDSDTPVNPFHATEFAPDELRACLGGRFRVDALLGLRHGPRLRAVEAATRRTLPDLVLAGPPHQWPWWLQRTVAAVRPSDFPLRDHDVTTSLDLVAVATSPA